MAVRRLSLQLGIFRLALLVTLAAIAWTTPLSADNTAEVEKRLLEAVRYIASDELEGRGLDTKGIQLAADYIAGQFRAAGLKTDLFDGTPFQKFSLVTSARPGERNEVELVGPDGQATPLKRAQNFNPLAVGGSGKFELPMVFAGYGITSKDPLYDDFAGVDVKGKAVVILRKEPQQGDKDSKFNGLAPSMHATFTRKISNAYQHGASAVILVNDAFDIRRQTEALRKRWLEQADKLHAAAAAFKSLQNPAREELQKHVQQLNTLTDELARLQKQLAEAADPLLSFESAGTESGGRDIPVIGVQRAALDGLFIAALGKDLAELEREIDMDLKPRSAELSGWKLRGEVQVQRVRTEVKNVVGVLEGEGPLADETIVIGAHYDHLGYGGEGSFVRERAIHNGADDNGSGTVGLIECARQLAARGKPRRRIVFIAFTGEEKGLHGSIHYANHPLFDMSKTVAMLNLDMIGRLNNEKLVIQGMDTAKEFGPLVEELNKKYGFAIKAEKGGEGPSDHTSFYVKGVPVMHFFTDTHADYHRPSDDADKLNISGLRRIVELVVEIAAHLASAEKRPEYVKVASRTRRGGGDRPYFGSIPAFGESDVDGLKLSGVSPGGPAEKAGIRADDVIQMLGDNKIGNLEDWDSALRKFKAGDKVKVQLLRGKEKLTVEVTLEPPR